MSSIFLTVGSQSPFDRLIKAVDAWAGTTSEVRVHAQIGQGKYEPKNMPFSRSMTQSEFESRLAECDLVVSHAGMGTIISALVASKPILVLPRHAALGETRNDHQIATAEKFAERGMLVHAANEGDLVGLLARTRDWPVSPALGSQASRRLLDAITDFVNETPS